jgi:hypothetical protein
MEAGHDFLPRFFYSPKPSRYFHILDWETAVKNLTSIIATGDYVHLKAISRQYPFIQSVESDDFLKKHDRFLVLNEGDQYPSAGKWFEARIKSNPGYEAKRLGTVPGVWGPLEVFLVERKGAVIGGETNAKPWCPSNRHLLNDKVFLDPSYPGDARMTSSEIGKFQWRARLWRPPHSRSYAECTRR